MHQKGVEKADPLYAFEHQGNNLRCAVLSRYQSRGLRVFSREESTETGNEDAVPLL